MSPCPFWWGCAADDYSWWGDLLVSALEFLFRICVGSSTKVLYCFVLLVTCLNKKYIVPRLSIASLISIRVLCKAGCKVVFTKNFCDVIYNNKFILQGMKDPSTHSWTLPINATEDIINKEDHVGKSHLNPKQPQIAAFIHSVWMRANAGNFARQSLCNPKFSTLQKATRRGFLTGCPNVNEKLILKYLNPSPARCIIFLGDPFSITHVSYTQFATQVTFYFNNFCILQGKKLSIYPTIVFST